MRYQHLIVLAKKCPKHRLSSVSGAKKLLDECTPPTNILKKEVLERSNGVVGYIVSDDAHLVLTTNPLAGQAFIEVRSQRPFDPNKLLQALTTYTGVSVEDVTYREFTENDYAQIECQEPRCRSLATKDYNGLKLCRDCYEQWLEKESESNRYKEYSG